MKIEKASYISPFGGINYIFNHLNKIGFARILQQHLPDLANQSKYQWKDLIYSLYAIYFCGGDCIEDIGGNFGSSLANNPLLNIPSPDRILSRLKSLSKPSIADKSLRGKIIHDFSFNPTMAKLNIKLLIKLGCFKKRELTIDYDNTIIFTEKADSKMTYKRDYGYQPGVATLDSCHILYLENRNGNSNAKLLQHKTLERMFDQLGDQITGKKLNFRADSASYQFEVVKLLTENKATFFIAAPTNLLIRHLKDIGPWKKTTDKKGEEVFITEIIYVPFRHDHLSSQEQELEKNQFRLIIKKKACQSGQVNMYTEEAFEYKAILTNDKEKTAQQIIDFYDKRGVMENQFDILKNDFGWNNMPFSKLEQNTVFLYFMAMCRNLYNEIISNFSTTSDRLKSNFRLKKFIFRFIAIPAKWIKRGRQNILKLYCQRRL